MIKFVCGMMPVGYLYLAFLPVAFGQIKRNESYLSLESLTPRSHVSHKTALVYRLNLHLESGHNADELDIRVNGTFLGVHENSLTQPNITWEDSLGNLISDDEMESKIAIEMIGNQDPLTRETIRIKMTAALGSKLLRLFCGVLEFSIADGAPLASLLRPLVYVTLRSKQVVIQTALIVGDYTFMETPEFELSVPVPTEIDMKQRSKVRTRVMMTTGPMGPSLLKLYMPNNLTMSTEFEDLYIEEPFLTLTSFKYNSSLGLSEDSVNAIRQLPPSFFSNSKTSEQDGVTITIPEISVSTTHAHIEFESEAEMLDFAGAYPGTEMMMVHVFQTGIDFFFIRNASVFAEALTERDRSPSLTLSLELLDTYRDSATLTSHFLIGLDHDDNSWGSAYNVSIMVYLPLFMGEVTLGKFSDVLRMPKQFLFVLDGVVLEFNLKRQSFVHSARIHVNITMDLEADHFVDGATYTFLAEAVYNGWRDTRDFSILDGFPITLGKDKGQSDNNCDEKGQNGGTCDNCKIPWQCYNTIEGHGLDSTLTDYHGNRFICSSATANRNSWEFEPCVKVDSKNRASAINPTLGTLLGTTENGLFGIARNGMAYVISNYGGDTWHGIAESIYKEEATLSDFVSAEFNRKATE